MMTADLRVGAPPERPGTSSAPGDRAGARQGGDLQALRHDVRRALHTTSSSPNRPQIAIGLGEGHQGPLEKWLNIPKTIVPGHPDLGKHLMEETVAAGSSRRCRTR
jgi:hypothetical protein